MTEHSQPLSAELIDRYLTRECTLAEVERVHAWLAENPEHEQAIAVLRTIGFETRTFGENSLWESPNLDDAWGRFERRCLWGDEVPVVSDAPGRRRVESGGWGRWMLQHGLSALHSVGRSGLSLGVVAVVGIVAFSWMFGLSGRMSHADSATVRRTFTTAVGQRATIQLTDGSRVTLAPSSTLEIPSEFGRHTRDVVLTGEAYFDVMASERAPFAVHTGNVRTDVLGTTFVVRRYADDGYTRIAVTTGRVSVAAVGDRGSSARHPTIVLAAGMLGEVTDTIALATTVTDMSGFTGWTNGQLAFHHTPVAQALVTLERWYGYQFRVMDSVLLQRDLTATFDEKDSSNMLMTLRTVLDARMTLDGAVVTFQARNASDMTSRDKVRTSSFYPSRKE